MYRALPPHRGRLSFLAKRDASKSRPEARAVSFLSFQDGTPAQAPLIAHPSRPAREIAQFVRAVIAYRGLVYMGFIWAYIGGICRGLAYRPHMQGLHTAHALIMLC